MSPSRPPAADRSDDAETTPRLHRRRLLALSGTACAALIAGCSSQNLDSTDETESSPSSTDTDTTATAGDPGTADTPTASGSFRLLISDRPAAIDDFDELNVSFDRARIHREKGTGDESDAPESRATSTTASATATRTPAGTTGPEAAPSTTATETAQPESTATESNATVTHTATEARDESSDGDQRGFSIVDLGGATVDLTQVVGERAISVFDGELPAGRYTKVELYAASVEGIVDGEPADVKIPSGKLQLTKPFEVGGEEPLQFVFDINVVEKGKNNGYNLLPVISESGVAGKDVAVDEVEKKRGTAGSKPSG